MIASQPMPFREALDAHAVKSLLPTTGKTSDLQRLDTAMKQRAFFSATVALARPLGVIREGVQGILAGDLDHATVRLGIKQMWERLGYRPDPEKAGGLEDLKADRRIDLQIETNVAVARGAGWHEQGMQPEVLEEFPALEFYDTAPGGEGRRDWVQRWIDAGGAFYATAEGRMVALRTDPVWENLGSPRLFPDGLGNPFPPFAFGSKWRTRDISHDEAVEIGLLKPGETQTPEPLAFAADLAATPELREQWLRDAITASGVAEFRGPTLVFNERPSA